MQARSILSSLAVGGCLFSLVTLLAASIDSRPTVLIAKKGVNDLNAKSEEQDLLTYFNSIPCVKQQSTATHCLICHVTGACMSNLPVLTSFLPHSTKNVNAFHEPSSQLTSINSNVAKNGADFSAKAAQKALISYFASLPTKAVNAFHDPAMAPHYYSAPEHLRQKLSDEKAYNQIDRYYSSVPAKDVNAFHDPTGPAHHAVHKFSAAQAELDLNQYYDALPSRRVPASHEPTSGENTVEVHSVATAATSGTVAASASTKRGVLSSAKPPQQPVAVQAKVAAKNVHQPYADSKISTIQDWGSDADAPTRIETARQQGEYDTQYGRKDTLVSKTMESTPSGPVETSFGEAETAVASKQATAQQQQQQQQQLSHVAKARRQHAEHRSIKSAAMPAAGMAATMVSKGLAKRTELTGRIGKMVGLGLCSIAGIACG